MHPRVWMRLHPTWSPALNMVSSSACYVMCNSNMHRRADSPWRQTWSPPWRWWWQWKPRWRWCWRAAHPCVWTSCEHPAACTRKHTQGGVSTPLSRLIEHISRSCSVHSPTHSHSTAGWRGLRCSTDRLAVTTDGAERQTEHKMTEARLKSGTSLSHGGSNIPGMLVSWSWSRYRWSWLQH